MVERERYAAKEKRALQIRSSPFCVPVNRSQTSLPVC
jgi:hypothetical protein